MSKLCAIPSKLFAVIECLFKKYPFQISIISFVASLVLYVIFPGQVVLTLIGSAFVSIFVALKYRLDQANYHKDLFHKRYKCFLIVDRVLDEWVRLMTANQRMIDELDSIMWKSYFLFGNQTYQFIRKFRETIVKEKVRNKTGENEQATDDSCFLEKLKMDENLLKQFAELKIDSY